MKPKGPLVLIALIFVFMNNYAIADTTVPEQFVNPTPPNSSALNGVWFNDDINLTRIPTSLYSVNPQTGEAIAFCKGLSDSTCANSLQFNFNALLPPCASIKDVDCIENLYAINPSSPEKIYAVIKKMIPLSVERGYEADPKNGLPQGANSYIWAIPGVNHAGGINQYTLVVTRSGSITKNTDGKFSSTFGSFRAAIFPITEMTNSAYRSNIPVISLNRFTISHPSQTEFRGCAVVGDSECALRQGFPPKTQFGVDIRLSAKLTGWLHGRIDQPIFDYKLTDYGTHLEIQGFPFIVPSVAGWINQNTLTSAQRDLFTQSNQAGLGGETNPLPTGTYSMNSLTMWLDLLGNKAAAMPSEWVFHTLDDAELRSASPCISSSQNLAGFVTTNATTYLAGAPVFNKSDQSLDYQVAAPHFSQDGSVFQGSYDLYLASQVARCIYGFSSAPIKATISVVDGSGGNQVATTVISQSDGWLHMAAKGFTFSSPNVKVRLSQDVIPVAITPSPAPTIPSIPTPSATTTVAASPSPTVTTKITPTPKISAITCMKGKVKKIVFGMKCPSGYKQGK